MQIVRDTTSHSTRSALKKNFSTSLRARIMQLWLQFQTLKKASFASDGVHFQNEENC